MAVPIWSDFDNNTYKIVFFSQYNDKNKNKNKVICHIYRMRKKWPTELVLSFICVLRDAWGKRKVLEDIINIG